jgi:prolyl-tRNA editing enzyme YbaK/EbsC (Cys-tRNA(Pro) deacylase)
VPLPASAQRVQNALAGLGLDASVVELPSSARTAQEAADSVGTTVGQIVKSLVFLCDGEPVLALVSGSNRLDVARLGAVAGGEIARADAAAVREATGYAIGGVPPVGHATRLPTFIDEDLLAYETVWAAGGTPHAVFEIAPDVLARAASASVATLRDGAG